MANDDPRDDRRRFSNERERVRDAAIPETDRAAVLSWASHKREANALSTATTHLSYVRRSAQMAAEEGLPPLVEWTQGDLEAFTDRLQTGDVPDRHLRHVGPDGWGEGSLRGFRSALKQFFEYLGNRSDDGREWTDAGARDWTDDIELGAPPRPKVRADDLLSPDELATLWSAIDDLRDRAMFAIFYCTWQRNAVVRSFRVGDVDLHDGGTSGVIRINEDAQGRKGATGRKPLSWAVGPVKDWLDAHPRGDDPDAPLLCITRAAGQGAVGDPLSRAYSVNRRLRTWAERAGLDRERWDTDHGRSQRNLKAHLLRYTGATRAAKSDDFGESTVKRWGGWTQNSNQLDRYLQLTDDDVLASVDNAHGIDSDFDDADHPEFGSCGRCGGPVEDWLVQCPACGHDVGAATPDTGPSLGDELGQAISELVREDPEAARELVDVVEQIGHPDD